MVVLRPHMRIAHALHSKGVAFDLHLKGVA